MLTAITVLQLVTYTITVVTIALVTYLFLTNRIRRGYLLPPLLWMLNVGALMTHVLASELIPGFEIDHVTIDSWSNVVNFHAAMTLFLSISAICLVRKGSGDVC